jgi:hypothetical protein
MNTTKTIRFFNKSENKGRLSIKSKLWNKKNKNKNITNANKNSTRFYYKEETKQSYNKKTYPKLVLNIFKVMKNSTSIYIHCAFNFKKFLKKISIYMWFMLAHVWTMNELD